MQSVEYHKFKYSNKLVCFFGEVDINDWVCPAFYSKP